jgi:hypothetical protein
LTARLAGVPLQVGGVMFVVVFGGPTTQVQAMVDPTQYVRPSEPVWGAPLNVPGVSEANVAWR